MRFEEIRYMGINVIIQHFLHEHVINPSLQCTNIIFFVHGYGKGLRNCNVQKYIKIVFASIKFCIL